MKRKKYGILIVIAAALVLLITVGVTTALSRSWGISIGRYLIADNGEGMMIRENSPIRMSNRTRRDLFDGLETGDKIWVLHDGIAESYPGQTGVYAVIRLGKGSIDDIPPGVLEGLRNLGWVATKEDPKSDQAAHRLAPENLDIIFRLDQ